MDSTTQRDYDDELAQEAPLVPDIGPDRTTETTSGAMRRRPSTPRTADTGAAIRHTFDDELAQEAPLVPDLGRTETTTDDQTGDTFDR